MAMAPDPVPVPVPVVDIRSGGPLRRAAEAADRARALRDECIAWLPRAAVAALPLIDAITRRWLARSRSPYVDEIAAIATTLNFSGIWFLNGCYQWGCTSLARDQVDGPWLARTLDWPFPGLGRQLEIAQMQGAAGAFDAVGWPGYAGVLTASAAGRFAACINQAPLKRRTRHPWLRPYDLALNAAGTWRVRHMPPDHLLRSVFETCRDFDEAKQRLATTPVARPVIYTLVGCRRGERCVIERTEQGAVIESDFTAAANDWLTPAPSWEARTRADLLFKRSYEEVAASSRERREQLAAWSGYFSTSAIEASHFDWVAPPILNPYTRLAVVMCPARGIMSARGYESTPGHELPVPITAALHGQSGEAAGNRAQLS